MPVHPFRFSLNVNQADGPERWAALAREAEAVGCASLLVSDHLGRQLAPLIAAMAAADATEDLRVGVLVAANDFRHPVVHAKELATLDLLSGGRAEWGMGAGWIEPEFEAAGIPFDPAPTRVERLEESILVMKALFAGEPVDHRGRHYTLSGQIGHPAPTSKPHPPLTIGGAQPRILRLAGREADIVSVNPSFSARHVLGRPPPQSVEEAVDDQVGWIASGAEGRPAPELGMTAAPFAVTDDPAGVAERAAPNQHLSPDEVLRSPHALIGSVAGICDVLRERRARWGISYWSIPAPALDAATPVIERLAGT